MAVFHALSPYERRLKFPASVELDHAVWACLLEPKSFNYFKTKSSVTEEQMSLHTCVHVNEQALCV